MDREEWKDNVNKTSKYLGSMRYNISHLTETLHQPINISALSSYCTGHLQHGDGNGNIVGSTTMIDNAMLTILTVFYIDLRKTNEVITLCDLFKSVEKVDQDGLVNTGMYGCSFWIYELVEFYREIKDFNAEEVKLLLNYDNQCYTMSAVINKYTSKVSRLEHNLNIINKTLDDKDEAFKVCQISNRNDKPIGRLHYHDYKANTINDIIDSLLWTVRGIWVKNTKFDNGVISFEIFQSGYADLSYAEMETLTKELIAEYKVKLEEELKEVDMDVDTWGKKPITNLKELINYNR